MFSHITFSYRTLLLNQCARYQSHLSYILSKFTGIAVNNSRVGY